jgi:hypothetical protein
MYAIIETWPFKLINKRWDQVVGVAFESAS